MHVLLHPRRDVLEGVLLLMGQEDTSWAAMRSFLGRRSVKEDIINFDARRWAARAGGGVCFDRHIEACTSTPGLTLSFGELLGVKQRLGTPSHAALVPQDHSADARQGGEAPAGQGPVV